MTTNANVVSTKEVVALYERFIKPLDNPVYLSKHRQLPPGLDLGPRWDTWDFPRVVATLELMDWAPRYNFFAVDRALVLSGREDPELRCLRAKHIDFVDYDLKTEANDLQTLDLPFKQYGFIMANQTLEHTYNPYACVQNIYNHLASGGFFYLNMPVLNIPHFVPFQYSTGFAPIGLLTLFHSLGFEILELGQWGNLEYIQKLFTVHYWPSAKNLASYVNEFRNAVSVWALVRKP
jgi:hypothetical protein